MAGRSRRYENKQMILVDSSVWIDFFNGQHNPQTMLLLNLMGQRTIIVGDIILTEVLQGFQKDKDFAAAKKTLSLFPIETICNEKIAIDSAVHFRSLRKKGITVRKTVGCIIATFCIHNKYILLHRNNDFLPFSKYLSLETFEF